MLRQGLVGAVIVAALAGLPSPATADAYAPIPPVHTGSTEEQAPDLAAMDAPLRLDEVVSFPLEGGCNYVSRVTGDLLPLDQDDEGAAPPEQQPQANAEAPKAELVVVPNLRVAAAVSCPGETTLQVSNNLDSGQPMTRAQLLTTLDKAASVASVKAGKRCIYMPEFQLTKEHLVGANMSYLCQVDLGQAPGGS